MSLSRRVRRYWKKQIAKEKEKMKMLEDEEFQELYSQYTKAKHFYTRRREELGSKIVKEILDQEDLQIKKPRKNKSKEGE